MHRAQGLDWSADRGGTLLAGLEARFEGGAVCEKAERATSTAEKTRNSCKAERRGRSVMGMWSAIISFERDAL